MEDEKFQLLCVALFFFVYLFLVASIILSVVEIVKIDGVKNKKSDCREYIDMTFEQCSKQGNVNLTSLNGVSKTLEYRDGICIIK